MDERFLSQPNVIRASRNFVCVRMMSYESASEISVLQAYWRPGAPLENTVFAITDPTGRAIVRGGRGPNHVYRDSSEMANSMDQIARYYNSNSKPPTELPSVDTVRLAMDVAACDKRPLVVCVGRNDAERRLLSDILSPVAWSPDLIGKLVYTTGSINDMRQIQGGNIQTGFVFVAPSLFGTQGSAMIRMASSATRLDLQRAARQAVRDFHPEYLNHHDHVRMGHQSGEHWETATPVTDPHTPENQGFRAGGPSGHGPPGQGPPGWGG